MELYARKLIIHKLYKAYQMGQMGGFNSIFFFF